MNFSPIKRLFPALLCALLFQNAVAQDPVPEEKTYRGIILDQKNLPVAGVTVSVQQRSGETQTNGNGEFSIAAKPSDILVFKKEGFLTAQKALMSDEPVTVVLQATGVDAGENDNVYIPFGVRTKRQVSAAVTTVSTEGIPLAPLADVKNLFSGRVSGLYLPQTNTAPGNDGTAMYIRGRNSFGDRSAKAYVDGVQREFGDMDLHEIESITVLKDAATLAWYGLRGGNGIVLVNTKKGNPDKPYIQLDVQAGFQSPLNVMKPLSSYNYARLYNEAAVNDGSATGPFTQAELDAYQNGTDRFRYPDNNYTEDFLRKSSAVQRYVLTTGGGNNTVRYFALLSYFNQGGLLNQTETPVFNSNTGYKKFNFRGNVDFDVNKYLTLTLNAGMRTENRFTPGNTSTDNTPPGLTEALSAIYNTPPNAFPILNQDGTLGGTSQFTANPLGLLQQSGYRSDLQRVLLATLNARQKLDFWVKGLSFNVLFSYDGAGTYTSGINQQYTVTDAAQNKSYLTASPVSYRSAGYSANNLQNELWVGFDYDNAFGLHTVNASVRAQRFADKQPERLDIRTQGLSSRVEYSYNQRYFVSLVGGYSGSENIAPGKRYGFFPAAAVGWVASEEAFLKNNKVFTYLKLRASYGTVGNDEIGGSRFAFESFYNRNAGGGGYPFGNSFAATGSTTEANLGNPNLTWETVTMANAGLDVRFLRNSLGLTVDLFQTRREDILTTNILPSILGQNIGLVNAGIVESKGLDASLLYTKRIGKLALSFNGNVLLSTNKVIAENGQVGLPAYQQTVGKPAGSYLVFLSDGLFQNSAQIAGSPRQTLSGRVAPGDVKYLDIGGPAGVPDGIVDNDDRVRINKSDNPSTYYGFGTALQFGVLDFSAQFQGVAGRTVNIQSIINSGPFSLNEESMNRWTPATAATAEYPRLGLADRGNNTAASDFWLRSGDFLRLKSVEAGVNLPAKLVSRFKMNGFRLYAGGYNLFSSNSLGLDIDPEIPGAGRGSAYPYVRSWTVGLTARF